MKVKKRYVSKTQKKLIAIIVILLFILMLGFYGFMVYSFFAREAFVDQAIKISDNNQESIFILKKILMYSSANAIDNTEDKSLKDIDISQFTDIAIYIDNTASGTDLTQKNTIKSLQISDISFTSDYPSGIKTLTYKSPMDFAKFKITDAATYYTENDTKYANIDYQIIYDNNTEPDYSKPIFFTDCSNPITLSYLNRNIVSHYQMSTNSNVSLNGSILKQANIDLKTLNTTISFNINITNNLDEKFVYNVILNLDIENDANILNGYSFQGKESSGKAYSFFKQ